MTICAEASQHQLAFSCALGAILVVCDESPTVLPEDVMLA